MNCRASNQGYTAKYFPVSALMLVNASIFAKCLAYRDETFSRLVTALLISVQSM
jgi:hypothetical protein